MELKVHQQENRKRLRKRKVAMFNKRTIIT